MRRGLKDHVLLLDGKGLSARQIADRLNVRIEYVRATRRRAGLVRHLDAYTKDQLKIRIASLRSLLRRAEARMKELSRNSPIHGRAAAGEEAVLRAVNHHPTASNPIPVKEDA